MSIIVIAKNLKWIIISLSAPAFYFMLTETFLSFPFFALSLFGVSYIIWRKKKSSISSMVSGKEAYSFKINYRC